MSLEHPKINIISKSFSPPISGCILAFIIFRIIVRLIFSKEKPVKSAKIVGPVIIGFTAFLSIDWQQLKLDPMSVRKVGHRPDPVEYIALP